MREGIHGASSDSGVSWEVGEDGIAEVRFDTPGEKVNLVTPQALAALEDCFSFMARQEDLKGLILTSGKPGVFIAGADVKLIGSVKTEDEGRGKALAGQMVFGKLAELKVPTVAAISGRCLGGGLEIALACRYRIAGNADDVQIGLPEVKLGIIPGWGGTQRLPRQVGLPAALGMILTGRTVDARRAKKMGLVDAVVSPERVVAEARRLVLSLSGRRRRERGALPAFQRLMLAWPARTFILSRAGSTAARQTGGHYPAPAAAIEAIGTGLSRGLDEGLRREAAHLGKLVVGEVSRNLVRIFLSSRGGSTGAPGRKVHEAGVLGAGVMGASIAGLAASKGFGVRLRDLAEAPLEKGMRTARKIIQGGRKKRRSSRWIEQRAARLRPTLSLAGFGSVDLVVEAVIEDPAIKKKILSEIEERVRPDCVIATNTSSIPVGQLASALKRPERFVGLHFFNPAEKMPLVEVVRGPRSSEETVETARAFAAGLGKTPVVVGDAPGFVVNRLLMPYLAEAVRMVTEGADPVRIDSVLKSFGMPMGPLALLDQIGIDVAAKVAGVLEDAFSPESAAEGGSPARKGLESLAEEGWLGAKSGRGFYMHQGRHRSPNPEARTRLRSLGTRNGLLGANDRETVTRRLLFPIINEAARVLEDKIASDAASVDLAMVFGTGFPPFRGGPLRWADSLGVPAMVEALEALAAAHGDHLAPSPALRATAEAGGFHRD